MSRHRYLIAYDIANPIRLRRVIKLMEGYGERLQYSVFLCDLSGSERAIWEAQVRAAMHLREDSVVWIDLGQLETSARINVIGSARRLPIQGPTIV